MDSPLAGSLKITTLRKLPTIAPKMKNKIEKMFTVAWPVFFGWMAWEKSVSLNYAASLIQSGNGGARSPKNYFSIYRLPFHFASTSLWFVLRMVYGAFYGFVMLVGFGCHVVVV